MACIAAFRGPQARITPSGYSGRTAHGKVVATWIGAVADAPAPLIASMMKRYS